MTIFSQTKYRVLSNLLIVLALFTMPWWFTVLLVLAAIFLFKHFFESLFFAIVLDSYYGAPGASFVGPNIFFLTVLGGTFLLSFFLKKHLRFYESS